jgi:hypothetical protein
MHKTIEDGLTEHECRWVFDTTPKTFCCARTLEGKSYCAEHAKIVYVPNQKPRRRTPLMLPVDPVAPVNEPVEHHPDVVEVINPER